ncbi:MAG: phage late control D family protein [Pyrinomonadaceae bacterium]
MPDVAATISIEDEPAPDLFLSLLEMDVEEDHRMAASFRIKVAITRQDDGLWTLLEDERIKPWAKITISVTVDDEEQEILSGYITQLKPHFAPDENNSYLEIWGMDSSCLMSLEEKLRAWPNMSDSDIAGQIFAEYSLTPEVEDTSVIHDEAIATIIQRDTDIQFLKRLARRNGFECFVNGETGFFRKPVLDGEPLPFLAAHFGAETNLVSFDAKLNSLRPTKVEMHQIDTVAKQVQDALVEAGEQELLGRDRAESVAIPNGIVPRLHVRQTVSVNQPEMDNLCRALFDEAEWLIEASGEVETVLYGAVLRAKSLVPIKGVGEVFSGTYYITNVKHSLKPDNYSQHFKARRNALAPSGAEDFGGDSLLGGLS